MFLLIVIFISLAMLLMLYMLVTPTGKYRRMGNQIPGPKTYPIIGDSYWFFIHKNFLSSLISLTDRFGKVSRLWVGKQLFVFITDVHDIKYFLTSSTHISKSKSYKLLDAWIGGGLIAIDGGETWRRHRKLLTPAFHYKILENSFEIVGNHTKELIKRLEGYANSSIPFDINRYLEKCITDVTYESAMGANTRTQTSLQINYPDILRSLTKGGIKRMSSFWLHPELLFSLSPTGREYYRCLKLSKKIVSEIIQERKKLLSSTENELNANEETGKRKLRSFMDILLLGNEFTDKEVYDEVQTYMLAGNDTTKISIVFCIYMLSKHADVQAKAVEEIKSIGENFTYQDLSKLRYLEKVIKESMRLYTTVPLIARNIDEEVTLPSGTTLPAGTFVNIFLRGLHHSEKHFPNPEIFNPERFNEDVERELYAYVPFSAGLRNCIGQKVAMLFIKTILSKLLMKYEISYGGKDDDTLTLDSRVAIFSEEEIKITIRERSS